MELLYYLLTIIRRRLLVIVLVTLLGAVGTYLFAGNVSPVYRSTITLSLNPNAPSQLIPYLPEMGPGLDRIASSYEAFLRSKRFGKLVVEKLNLSLPPEAITGAIGTGIAPNTNLFRLSVTWPDPIEAQSLANGIAQIFIDENLRIQQTEMAPVATELEYSAQYYQKLVNELRKQRDALLATPNAPQWAERIKLAEERLVQVEGVYRQYAEAVAGVRVRAASRVGTASVMDPAEPGVRITPDPRRNVLLGSIFSLVLGIALAVTLEYLDRSLKTPDQVKEATGLEPMAAIGIIEGTEADRRSRRRSREAQSQSPASADGVLSPTLITARHPKDPVSEAFRALRTNLQFSDVDNPPRSLLVTSSLPQEGKTTICCNLAITFAQTGRRVIVVDSDLRRPSMHRLFGVPNREGFTSLLLQDGASGRNLSGVLKETPIPGLLVLPSGPLPPNPAELLESQKATSVMEQLKQQADIVIYDSPPAGPLTDAAVLASKVDGVVLVIEAGKTPREPLLKALQNIQVVEGRVLGLVLNMLRPDHLAYGYYPYYYYYYRHYYSPQGRGAAGAGEDR